MPTLQAFDGDTLEAALARVTEEVGRGARITQAEKIRTGGVAGFFAKERYEVIVEVDEPTTVAAAAAPAAPSATPDAAPEPASAEPMSLLELAEQVSRQERGDGPAPAAADAPAPSTEGKTFKEVLRGITSEAGFFDGPTTESTPAPASAPAPTQPDSVDSVTSMLRALGVPGHLLGPATEDRTVAQHILRALERIPSPAPVVARRGDVVVVVGDERVATEAAALLAAQVGQTIDDVVLAGVDRNGFNTLSTPDEAQRQTALWRSCGAPFVVAVCPPEGAAGVTWARSMLEALDPVTAWAAVRADRKPDDVAAWLERLGPVDALAVGACADTFSPAAVLSTGVPVAALEGRRATPAAWTALLVERLAA